MHNTGFQACMYTSVWHNSNTSWPNNEVRSRVLSGLPPAPFEFRWSQAPETCFTKTYVLYCTWNHTFLAWNQLFPFFNFSHIFVTSVLLPLLLPEFCCLEPNNFCIIRSIADPKSHFFRLKTNQQKKCCICTAPQITLMQYERFLVLTPNYSVLQFQSHFCHVSFAASKIQPLHNSINSWL